MNYELNFRRNKPINFIFAIFYILKFIYKLFIKYSQFIFRFLRIFSIFKNEHVYASL